VLRSPQVFFAVAKSSQALKFEIPKSVKQDFAPYHFASEIYTAKLSAAQSLIYPTPKA